MNKTQIREILANRRVWDNLPATTREKINGALSSDGTLFRLTSRERSELRNALNHARVRSDGFNTCLYNLYLTTMEW